MNNHLEELKIGGRPMTKNEIKIKQLQDRINKAIEYIENDMFEDYCVTHKDSEQQLLSILKGVDKE